MDKSAKLWKERVQSLAKDAARAHGVLSAPLSVEINFVFKTDDQSLHGKPHTQKPDIDNLQKLAYDAMVKDANGKPSLIKDDSIISHSVLFKRWGKQAYMSIRITEDDTVRTDDVRLDESPEWLQNVVWRF